MGFESCFGLFSIFYPCEIFPSNCATSLLAGFPTELLMAFLDKFMVRHQTHLYRVIFFHLRRFYQRDFVREMIGVLDLRS